MVLLSAEGSSGGSFYSLEPIGVGTGDCENLVSYLCRLAAAHCVTVDDLVNKGLSSYSSTDFGIWRHFSTWSKWCAVNLYAPNRTVPLRDALIAATNVGSLTYLSLDGLADVIDLAGMAASAARHCPVCVASDGPDRGCRPILWDIQQVQCCVRHSIRLVPSWCGRSTDQQQPRWLRTHLPGVCTGCGSIAHRCQIVEKIAASREEQWVADQAARLVAAVTSGETFSRETVRSSVEQLASLIGEGKPYRSAAICGINKARLHDWINGRRMIKYAPLLALCAAAGADMVSAMRGEIRLDCSVGYRYVSRSRRTDIASIDERRVVTLAALEDEDCPSVTELASRLRCHRTTLEKKFPEETKEIARRFCQSRAEQTALRRRAVDALLWGAVDQLRREGIPVTVRNIWSETGVLVTPGSRYESLLLLESGKNSDI